MCTPPRGACPFNFSLPAAQDGALDQSNPTSCIREQSRGKPHSASVGAKEGVKRDFNTSGIT